MLRGDVYFRFCRFEDGLLSLNFYLDFEGFFYCDLWLHLGAMFFFVCEGFLFSTEILFRC